MENWQRLHIEKNLSQLVELTQCNVTFLTCLKEANVLSNEEVEIVESKSTFAEKANSVYAILLTRVDAYDILKRALQKTSQSGVLNVLCEPPTNYKYYGSITLDKNSIIGRGSKSTKVYKGKFGGREVAVKVVECHDMQMKNILTEIECLKQLDCHPNVVRFFTADQKFECIYIALESCVGNLQHWIEQKIVQRISEKEILLQTTKGLCHLHKNNLIHRDLKPANILLTHNSQVKISDFGLSKKLPDDASCYTHCSEAIGTQGWMAPEVCQVIHGQSENSQTRLTPALDIFSLGCIFYYVLTGGVHPFGDYVGRQYLISKGKPIFIDADCMRFPGNFLSLTKVMISHDPRNRPSAASILAELNEETLADQKLVFPEIQVNGITVQDDNDHAQIVTCNKISYDRAYIMGKGHSSLANRGKFDSREVAVKRVPRRLDAMFNPMDEIEMLLKCDKQENVVKYFCYEVEENSDNILSSKSGTVGPVKRETKR